MSRQRVAQPDLLAHPLSAIRAERNWTYQDVVNIVARRVGNVAARREKAWRWENWGVVPDLDSQLALADELCVPESRVKTEAWPAWLPDGDPVRFSFDWTQDGGMQALDDAVENAVMDRRGFLKIAGGSLIGLAEEWLGIEPGELVAVLKGGQVTIDFIERMEEGLPRLRLLESTHGGSRARRLIDAELGMVVEVLEQSSYTAVVGKRLYRLAAELGRMAGWASFDAGMHAAAQRYWVAALHAAHAANERLMGANILKSMSLQCYDFSLPREALALASSAYTGAVTATPRAAAMLALRLARAHAALGEATACERVISEADTLFANYDAGDDDPAWLAYFDESEFYAQIGTCYLDLKKPRKADAYLIKTLRLASRSKVRDQATYVIRRASAQMQLKNADRANSLLQKAIPLIQQAPSERNVRRLVRARERLPFSNSDPRTRHLDDQLSALVA
ncbi:transcriptional regulator [Actinoplanes sp. GCM10030250]|uniref:transcriptional regulator n=1 Tax=Actinoplanes sp. GCM10030250 TaxID=3273376 RepID=UPI003617EC65